MKTEILIVGSGCAALYCALHLPKDMNILMITKGETKQSDSYLAQGGICMLRDASDYNAFFEDTMKAGHYENDPASVTMMINSSQEVIADLIQYGTRFQRDKDGSLCFTREGAHSDSRILYHKDITGKEITSHLLKEVKKRKNIQILEHCRMLDLVCDNNTVLGVIAAFEDKGDIDILDRTKQQRQTMMKTKQNSLVTTIRADYVMLATGGIGGLYEHSTNYSHLTGDAVAIALKQKIALRDMNYVQIHPTTLYTRDKSERSFLISESVRGEGAQLYNAAGERFVNELLPRDLLTKEIQKQMKKDDKPFVWLSMLTIPDKELEEHFPNIVEHCKKMGYDVKKEWIPVVPAQHYYMGGVAIDLNGRTSMKRLYAAGETACNGVHGRNRLASNSLLESLVFAKRAAADIALCKKSRPAAECGMVLSYYETETEERHKKGNEKVCEKTAVVVKKQAAASTPVIVDLMKYQDIEALEIEYKDLIFNEMERLEGESNV